MPDIERIQPITDIVQETQPHRPTIGLIPRELAMQEDD